MGHRSRPLRLQITTPSPTLKRETVEPDDTEHMEKGDETYDPKWKRFRKVYSGSTKDKKEHYNTSGKW